MNALQGSNGAQLHVNPDQAEGMGTFAGDAALWAAGGGSDPGHQMFDASDPMIYLRYVADLTHPSSVRRQARALRGVLLFVSGTRTCTTPRPR